MTPKPFKILFGAFAFFSLVFFINSCKKNAQDQNAVQQGNEKIPDWVLKNWGQQNKSSTYLINKTSSAIYVDDKDHIVTFRNGVRSDAATRVGGSASTLSAPCDQDDDDFLDNTFTYQNQTTAFACGADYIITIEYQLSTAFVPSLTNPANPSQLSRGRMRVKNVAGTVIWSNSSITPITIVPLGNDPQNANKQLYKITYTVTVPVAIMTGRGIDEHRPIIYTNCPDVITTAADWQWGLPGGVTGPCDKIDNIYITPMGSNYVAFGGCDQNVSIGGASCYPGGLASARPDEHDIEWRIPGGAWPNPLPASPNQPTVLDYSQRVSWQYLPSQGCSTSPGKQERLKSIAARSYLFPTGVIEIRYRNVKLNTPVTSPCAANNCTSAGWVYRTITVY